MVVLGLVGVSGSSLGLYATDNGIDEDDAGVVAGAPRPIRTDEWAVRTPWVLRQLERNLADRVAGGVGTHDTAILYDLPIGGWEVVLRPQTAGYRLLGAERGFATEWWMFLAIQLLGVYALLLTLTGNVAVSALAASLLTLSPVSQWWTTPATYTTVGYGCLATALALLAHRARTLRGRVAISVLAGLALAAFLAALYPPWQIGVGLVLVPVAVASVAPDVRRPATRRGAVGSLAVVLAVSVGVAGGLFAGFVVSHRDAVDAVSATVYPGRRTISEGGGVDLRRVLSAPFDSFAASRPYREVNGTNQSENSSALPLLLVAGVASAALARKRRLAGSRSSAALVGCLVGGGIVAGWMLLPVPAAAGRLLLLTRVDPGRMVLPVALAGVLALALLISHQADSGNRITRWEIGATAAGTGAVLLWGASRYSLDGAAIDLRLAGAAIAVVLAGLITSLGRRPVVGLTVLALFGAWQASLVNPVQDGIAPLTASRLRAAVDAARRADAGDAGWIVFGRDLTVTGTITAAGVNNVSGVSPYPDEASWRLLDPSLASVTQWNRYAHVFFSAGGPGTTPTFALGAADDLVVTVDPCSPAVRDLGVSFAVAVGFELAPCARPLARLPWGESFVVVYRY